MKTDVATRVLLALILLCLLVLVARGFFWEDAAPPRAAPPEPIGAHATAPPAPGAPPAASPLPPPTEAEIQLLIDALLGDKLPPEVRAWTAQQLGAVESEQAAAALQAALADPEPLVAAAAAEALSRRGESAAGASREARAERPSSATGTEVSAPPGLRIETLD